MTPPATHRTRITIAATAFAAAVAVYFIGLVTLDWPRIGVPQAASIVLILVSAAALFAVLLDARDDQHQDQDDEPEPEQECDCRDETMRVP